MPLGGQQNPSTDSPDRRKETTDAKTVQRHWHRCSSERLVMRTQDNALLGGTTPGMLGFGQAQIGLCYLDTDLRYVEINDWLAALNGLTPAQHVGQTIGDVLPSVGESVARQLRQVIETGEPILKGLAYAETAAHPGTKRLYQHDYYPDKANDGTVVGVKCIVQSITHQKLTEVAGVIPWEADARTWEFSYVGPQAEEMLGYPTERWYDSGFWASCVHPDDREDAVGCYRTRCRTQEHFECEYRMIKADGTSVWLRDVVDVDSIGGEPIILRGFMFDISDLKEAREAAEHGEQTLRTALQEIEKLKQRLEGENLYLRQEIGQTRSGDELVGESNLMRQVTALVEQVAPTDATVLILGETGTGKELIARSIHEQSRRAAHPLIRVSCATLPSTLIESELFGHEKGAFTGAISRRIGRFELADGGTIFLDEIGDLPLELQPKLLRVLQEGEFERLGSTKTITVDVRVIAATNRDLDDAVATAEFRKDLYYRLQAFPITVPPLRERRGDIPLLVWYLLGRTNVNIGRAIDSIPDDVMQRLVRYPWPGNVRELENVIERAVILTQGQSLQLEGSFGLSDVGIGGRRGTTGTTSARLEDVERAHILRVLQECGWRIKGKSNAAERLGLHPSTLLHRLKRLGIERPLTIEHLAN